METWLDRQRRVFAQALDEVAPDAPVVVLCHKDADGLTAGAVLARGLARLSRPVSVRLVGRGESPWSDPVQGEVRSASPGLVIVADLGVRADVVAPGAATVLIDHHVPQGMPEGATVISGYGQDPVPSSSLLAYWCVQAEAEVDDLLWLAALGLIGDYGEKAPFAELADARSRYGAKTLREAASLINAPRRSASGDAGPAFDFLLKSTGPKDILSDAPPEAMVLRQAKDEVKREFDAARRIAPRFSGSVALIELSSPCQIHPLVAQSWAGRLKNQIVIAANTGFRSGYVHFAVRSATGRNLVEFLKAHAPPGAEQDGAYGQGHEQASGGALRAEPWKAFLDSLGF
ncbi:DHH family phosphoesterase [Microvirga pakistanensis]|uniref:DHH family phosphoesterase n=1 Tax=Microvirga pakistanensis TaxID=1682650 RepID=UPI001FCE7781|nr:DHH family phosphoesterase [Microvirga pakistanensis]